MVVTAPKGFEVKANKKTIKSLGLCKGIVICNINFL